MEDQEPVRLTVAPWEAKILISGVHILLERASEEYDHTRQEEYKTRLGELKLALASLALHITTNMLINPKIAGRVVIVSHETCKWIEYGLQRELEWWKWQNRGCTEEDTDGNRACWENARAVETAIKEWTMETE